LQQPAYDEHVTPFPSRKSTGHDRVPGGKALEGDIRQAKEEIDANCAKGVRVILGAIADLKNDNKLLRAEVASPREANAANTRISTISQPRPADCSGASLPFSPPLYRYYPQHSQSSAHGIVLERNCRQGVCVAVKAEAD